VAGAIQPKKMTKQIREAKLHHLSIISDHLTKQFTKYRDLSGVYDHMTKEERPTFHCLRAYETWQYRKAGGSDEYIMVLDGHAGIKMSERYSAGHEKVVFMRVQAGF
jgi:hypothetical protein